MRPSRTIACLVALVATAVCAAPASAVSFDRAWGADVITGGPTGAEICTVAANCKAGVSGTDVGMFQSVNGVVADNAGNVYVAESSNIRVSKYDENGNFVVMWGKGVTIGGTAFEKCFGPCQAGQSGGGPGEMLQPRGIAVSRSADVYVADFGNRRIDKFDSDGNFVMAWGKDVGGAGVDKCTVTCNAGGLSTGPGDEFQGPNGVAVDEAGNVYVIDETARRVQKFDSNGNFIFAIGKGVATGVGLPEICTTAATCQLGAGGAEGGDFDSPTGVAADAGGFFVTDEGNQRVDKFGSDGSFAFGWGRNVNGGSGDPNLCTVGANCVFGATGVEG